MSYTEQIAKEIEKVERPSDDGRKIRRASDLLRKDVEDIPTLFDPVFPVEGIATLAGESDACKSMLLRNMAICVTTGRDFLGWSFKGKHRSCIFVSTEDDENPTSYLLRKHNATFHEDAENLSGLRFIFDNENIIEELKKELSIEPADLVVVDAYSDVFDGKEQNSAAQTRDFINPYKQLAKEHGCLIIFLHHTGKGKENLAPSKNNLVGSQSYEAAVRLAIELRIDKDDPSLRHFCIVKGNYLGSDYKRESYVLHMDENFVFTNTDKRTPFEKLGNPDAIKFGRPRREVESFGEEVLKGVLRQSLKDGNLGKTALRASIEKELSCAHEKTEEIICTAVNKGWIKDISPNKRYKYELQI